MAESKVKKEGWNAEELGEQSAYEDTTEIERRLGRATRRRATQTRATWRAASAKKRPRTRTKIKTRCAGKKKGEQ